MKPHSLFPVMFIGHGTPMNAIEDNEFSNTWHKIAASLPRPRAILCISAHWETLRSCVTAMEKPQTIHDFGGFPRELYAIEYPAPGDPSLAKQVQKAVKKPSIELDSKWGLDHGCWSVIRRMYPKADIPVIQLSLGTALSPTAHYALGQELSFLRQEEVLILGSGNMVHNLGLVEIPSNDPNDFNKPFGFDWAIETNELFKKLILENRHQELIDFHKLGPAANLAINTAEHFLPLLYVLALKEENETVEFFNDQPVGGSVTMTSVVVR